jgi:hypothetical protein
MLNRVLKLVEESEHKDHLYQMAGDVIVGIPERMDQLDVALDRTGLALSKIGEEFLDARLTLSDKNLVEEAVSSAFGNFKNRESVRASESQLSQKEIDFLLERAGLDPNRADQISKDPKLDRALREDIWYVAEKHPLAESGNRDPIEPFLKKHLEPAKWKQFLEFRVLYNYAIKIRTPRLMQMALVRMQLLVQMAAEKWKRSNSPEARVASRYLGEK